jgi:putative salt-induced outer membrane protein YdiY
VRPPAVIEKEKKDMRLLRPDGLWAQTAIAALALLAVTARAAVADDELKVGGDVLRGTIDKVTPSTIEFTTNYGEGSLSIAVEDVESISSERDFYFIHGDDGTTRGRLLAIRDGSFIVGQDEATATAIETGTIHEVYDAASMEGSMGWFRRATALWHGTFDIGYGLVRSTTDTSSFATGLLLDRRKAPSRVTFTASYRYATQKEDDDDPLTDDGERTTENEAKGMLRGEYDIIPRLYWYGSQDAEYDEIESLSYRLVPKTGLGYRFWDTETFLFQLDMGGAYVYENFFGSDDAGYFSIAFGKLLEWEMPWLESSLRWKTDYLPAVDDWGDFLVRSEAALLVPMISWLKFRIAVSETHDSTPADGADKNTLATTAGLAAVY